MRLFMNDIDLEQLFFRPRPRTAEELTDQRRQTSTGFQPPPVRTENHPYRLDFASLFPARARAIEEAGQIAFHMVGDTGGIHGRGAQQNVADQMTRQVYDRVLPDQPSFFYHLGDIVYFRGEEALYHDQFYHPYQNYPAPIFAIPGNHDGEGIDTPHSTLAPFMYHFCSPTAVHPVTAGHSTRPTMTQPNCYWTLRAPFVTIIGLYSNVTGELDNTDRGETTQRDWLTEEMKAAPTDRCLLLAVHHPIFSLGSHGPTPRVAAAVDYAIKTSGRFPDAVFSGHEHNYQRFTQEWDERRIAHVVAGAGGHGGYHLPKVKKALSPPRWVRLKYAEDENPGFLTILVSKDRLIGRYFTVPEPGRENDPARRVDKFTIDLTMHRVR
jgi:acid phosphatase type 7